MVMDVTFIPNWVENQDAGRWCPHESVGIYTKEALLYLLDIAENLYHSCT